MDIRITEVTVPEQLRRFIEFPSELYKNTTTWVSPLRRDEKKYLIDIPALDPAIRTRMFLAADEQGKILGRLQIIVNENEIRHFDTKIARFNKFDFVDDHRVSRALIRAAEKRSEERRVGKER